MLISAVMNDANKTAKTLMQASLDNVRATQATMKRQRELVSKMENPVKVKWTDGPVPMPVFSYEPPNSEASREAFHLMADANLKAWEIAAQAYSAFPSWMKAPVRDPGEFWANWFDQYQAGEFDKPINENFTRLMGAMMPKFGTDDAAAEPADIVEKIVEEAPSAPKPAKKTEAKTEFLPKTDEFMPELLRAPMGEADELTKLKGVGPKLQKTLNDLGVFHFSQIASWTPENIGWLDEKLAFKGRIYREGWVEQAQALVE